MRDIRVPKMTFYNKLPKIELHAHLNGSLTPTIIEKLLSVLNLPSLTDEYKQFTTNITKFQDFFSLFDFIYKLASNCSQIRLMTSLVIRLFHSEHCVYLELRSTPKKLGNETKQDYLQAMLQGIKDCQGDSIITRLIVSIDRRHSLEESMETLDAVLQINSPVIVALDLCGDPTRGEFEIYRPVFEKARLNGLKLTFHFAEVPDMDSDNMEMLNLKPDRLSHCINLTPKMTEMIIKHKIPMEVCLTSNLSCKAVKDISVHHFQDFYKQTKLALCTDDVGVFHSGLSDEYELCAGAYGLSNNEVFELSKGVIEMIFDDSVKQQLRDCFTEFGSKNPFYFT